ncbi:hypothetical protein SAMN05444157_0934 [Frankineae bacterium MT45]|nr:hypothetical protein SAMN05444157_0934 [Frankineae bacterium MT45]
MPRRSDAEPPGLPATGPVRAGSEVEIFEIAPYDPNEIEPEAAPLLTDERPVDPGPTDEQLDVGSSPVPRRRAFILAGVVAVAFLLTGSLYAILHRPATPLTLQHEAIVNAPAVLGQAEALTAEQVSSRHGVSSADTRCYFSPAAPGGQSSGDITPYIYCGPVLFIQGTPTSEYVVYRAESIPSDHGVSLTVNASDLTNPQPQPLPPHLLRPDGQRPPSGDGGLTPPPTPYAQTGTLEVGLDQLPLPEVAGQPTMGGRSGAYTLARAGYLAGYGSGDFARRAAPGQRLIGFEIDSLGLLDGYAEDALTPDRIGISVDHGPVMVISSDQQTTFGVVSVPSAARDVELVLTGDGLTQTISLPGGRIGAKNVAVLGRRNRVQAAGIDSTVTASILQNGRTTHVPLRILELQTELAYTGVGGHHAAPGMAELDVYVQYSVPGLPDPTGTTTLPPELLSLTLPGGKTQHAPTQIRTPFDVAVGAFQVPAEVTAATLTISGSGPAPGGGTMTLAKPLTIPLSFPAG